AQTRAARRAPPARDTTGGTPVGARFPAGGEPDGPPSGRRRPLVARRDDARLGAGRAGARLRGGVRPRRRAVLPPPGALPPLATRPRSRLMPARAAGACVTTILVD